MTLSKNFDFRQSTRPAAFTLVELLVVIGIVSLLIAILIPSIARARYQSRTAQCAANMRQICQGMYTYAADNKNRFPLNIFSGPGKFWFDAERIGGQAGGIAAEPVAPECRVPVVVHPPARERRREIVQ